MKKLTMSIIILCVMVLVSIPSSLYAQQLLSPAKLKSWIDHGYIDDMGRKVVILDAGIDWTNPPFYDHRVIYDTGHIPGAYYVPSSLLLFGGYGLDPLGVPLYRTDGIIKVSGLVPYGPLMDFFVQNYGIDRGTAVVFTGSEIWTTTRAYWVFRYWGFNKDHLFILNGEANGYAFELGQPPGPWRSVWQDAGYELELSEPPPPIPSTFSVSSCPGNMDAVRAPTEEFFLAAQGSISNAVIFDARTVWDCNAVIPIPGWNDTAVFAFKVKNSICLAEELEFLVETGSGAHVFKSEQDIIAMLQAKGITEAMVPYSFCGAGGWATVSFFVYDAILGRPAKIHDGSYWELGQLGYLQDNGIDRGLPEDSPWRFDLDKYCSILNYNPYPALVTPPQIVDAYAISAHLVNDEDKAYYTPLPDVSVAVDIKPGSCPNPMRLKCTGVLPVAVLGTDAFNVMDIDLKSIRITREGLPDEVAPIRHNYEDVGTPFAGELCDCHSLRQDGYMDLSLKFMVSEIVEGLKLNELADRMTIPLTIVGETYNCMPIRGEDCILIIGNLQKDCRSDLDCDADVDGTDAAMFKEEFGRRNCSKNNPCISDFQSDGDVDGSDVVTFKSEYGTIFR